MKKQYGECIRCDKDLTKGDYGYCRDCAEELGENLVNSEEKKELLDGQKVSNTERITCIRCGVDNSELEMIKKGELNYCEVCYSDMFE